MLALKLLTDRTLDIPPFLLRTPDGGFAHPACEVPKFTAAVNRDADDTGQALAGAMAASKRQDDAIRGALLHAETLSAKERNTEQAVARKAQKAADAERLLKNKLKQREVFIQHFKWDHEK